MNQYFYPRTRQDIFLVYFRFTWFALVNYVAGCHVYLIHVSHIERETKQFIHFRPCFVRFCHPIRQTNYIVTVINSTSNELMSTLEKQSAVELTPTDKTQYCTHTRSRVMWLRRAAGTQIYLLFSIFSGAKDGESKRNLNQVYFSQVETNARRKSVSLGFI